MTSLLVADEKLPISQKTIAGNLFSGSATYLVNETKEEKNDPTIIPANTRISVDDLLNRLLIPYAKPTATMPKIIARIWIENPFGENKIAKAAPKPAPDVTPSMSGDTSGFFRIP
jgi:hypothetical protein